MNNLIENIFFLLFSGALIGFIIGFLLLKFSKKFILKYNKEIKKINFKLFNLDTLTIYTLIIFPFITILILIWRGISPNLINDLVFVSCLFGIAIIDWETQFIDNRILLFGIVIRFFWILIFEPSTLIFFLEGLTIGAGILYFVGLIYETIRKKKGLGNGDPAVLGYIGFWVGVIGLGPVLLLSSISGLIIGSMILLVNKKSILYTPIPFGPYLCFGGMFTYFFQ